MFEFLKRRTPRHVEIVETARQRAEELEERERTAPPPSFIQQHLDAQHDRTLRLAVRQHNER